MTTTIEKKTNETITIKNGFYNHYSVMYKVTDEGILCVYSSGIVIVQAANTSLKAFDEENECEESQFVNAYNKAVSNFAPFVNNAKPVEY